MVTTLCKRILRTQPHKLNNIHTRVGSNVTNRILHFSMYLVSINYVRNDANEAALRRQYVEEKVLFQFHAYSDCLIIAQQIPKKRILAKKIKEERRGWRLFTSEISRHSSVSLAWPERSIFFSFVFELNFRR